VKIGSRGSLDRGLPLLLLPLVCTLACARESSPAAARARVHLDTLATTIGSRPVATEENRAAREYLVGVLARSGFSVRVQDAEAVRTERGDTLRIANIIATRPGSLDDAIGLVSHYDSSPFAPGASDAALGVSVVLESARQLVTGPALRHSLMVILTDGEEAGLMGAAALVRDPEVLTRLKVYLNHDALGPSGPSVLFEATDGVLVDAWRRASPEPRGTSYAIEIYKRLPNDTDFTVLNASGIRGLNFATIGESAVYHTARDTADRISADTLRQSIANTVAIVRELDGLSLAPAPDGGRVFFDVLGSIALSYGPTTAGVLAVIALVTSALLWIRLFLDARRHRRLRPGALTLAWSVVTIAVVVAVLLAEVLVLRLVHGTYHPWYAHPDRLLGLFAATMAATLWAATRLGRRLPERLRGSADPRTVWLVTLPLWMTMAAAIQIVAPGASYLWVLPLLSASVVLLPLPLRWPWLLRMTSFAVFALVGLLWIRDTWVLHRFLVEQMARTAIRPPAYVYVMVPIAAVLMLAPPLVAASAGTGVEGSRPRGGRLLALTVLTLVVGVLAAPSYTFDRPLRRTVRYLDDGEPGQAVWEVGSLEPGLDLAATPDAPVGWALAGATVAPSLPVAGTRRPFVYRAPAAARPFPGEIHVRATPAADTIAVELTVVAPEDSEVVFAVPSAAAVERPTRAGAIRRGYWLASYGGLPVGGVTLGFAMARMDLDRLGDAMVVVSRARLSGGPGWQGLPGWLPQDRTVWAPREVFVRRVAAAIRTAASTGLQVSLR
jgi:hypothetical protein